MHKFLDKKHPTTKIASLLIITYFSENDFKVKISPKMIQKMSIKEMKSYVEQSIEVIQKSQRENENLL